MTLIVRSGNRLLSYLRKGVFSLQYPCKNTQRCDTIVAQAFPGEYLLEVWGAEGSSVKNKAWGKGGYSRGKLHLERTTQLFINIGGKGEYYDNKTGAKGGNNGGGTSYFEDRQDRGPHLILWYGTGGGATDIRIGSNDLSSRVIVAGGGASAGAMYIYGDRYYQGSGGCGGGTTGGNGEIDYSSSSGQDGGCGGGPDTEYRSTSRGTGGGFYIGDKGLYGNGSGGGSGFVFTGETDGISLSNKYYLSESITLRGDESIPGFDGQTVTGNSGSGAIKITIIQPYDQKIYMATLSCTNNFISISYFIIMLFSK